FRSLAAPLIPDPNGAQSVPFQRAMLSALTPPAVVNPPLARRSPLVITARALTPPGMPLSPDPSGTHAVPFQREIAFALTPPAVLKLPPAIKSPLCITASFRTSLPDGPLIPDPSGAQFVPFQR